MIEAEKRREVEYRNEVKEKNCMPRRSKTFIAIESNSSDNSEKKKEKKNLKKIAVRNAENESSKSSIKSNFFISNDSAENEMNKS